MNCAECRDHLVAWLEQTLEPEPSRQCQAHVENCAECRAEYDALVRLQERLAASAETAREVSLVGSVMRQVRNAETARERSSIMSKLLMRWGLGLGAATAAAVLALLLISPRAHATAGEIMARGAQALGRLTSIHLRGQVRTLPQDNFSLVMPDLEFSPIEMWKQFTPELKWRVDKEGRMAAMDGQSTLLYLKPANLAMKLPQPSGSAFDTDWLQRIANLSNTITNEIANAKAKGWKLGLMEKTGSDGRKKQVVTVEAKAGLPDNDYLKNKFFDTSDTRRVYTFDGQTELLEAVQVFMATKSGEVEVFDLTQIECNQPIDPAVFHLDLPADVNWYQEPQVLADNAKYAAMTPEQAARAFFEAMGRGDWTEVAKFDAMPFSVDQRAGLTGLTVVSIGDSFTSQEYPGRFVPYEIKFAHGEVQKHSLALKKDTKTSRWIVDGGF